MYLKIQVFFGFWGILASRLHHYWWVWVAKANVGFGSVSGAISRVQVRKKLGDFPGFRVFWYPNPSLREGLNLALRDIELALATSKYPEEKAFKLYERQGECYAALGNADLAMESYQMAMTMIKKNSRLPKDKLKKFILGIQKKLENLQAESKSNGVVTKK